MSDAPVLLRWEGRLAFVLLRCPSSGNALSPALVNALDGAIDAAEAGAAEGLVLEGEGRHFCTGFDLSNLAAETDDTLILRFVRIELLLQRIARLPMRTVAIAHGRTMGAGADLFAACTFRLARDDATFAFPGARGFGLALGSRRLAARIGVARAEDWVLSARQVGVDEAVQCGFVTHRAGSLDAVLRSSLLAQAAAPDAPAAWVTDALHGNQRQDDASDLFALVRSAAARGLRDRIAAYVERQAAARLRR